ncbi:MAG: 16S rRNA (guanine(527)-N(7))-methyltransferase RsmG [Bdellovibrionaceae bacterium]|jgi:16S rRNA (guanine527-N7)-methyltransferase|nr:16S rRNA (guanine(527)-N(7))-methyltransferase RsmG [Pseudobdellovibrionaceae bacterium]
MHKRGTHKKPEKIFSVDEANDRIYDIFRNHNFDYPHDKRLKLAQFYELLMKNQETENFTRLTKIRDVAIKHYIDSLIILNYTDLKFPLVDMGTGPGFPGIPLKIHFPEEKIILVEGVKKRIQFLKDVREKLELKELDIIGRYVTPDFVLPVKGLITRAVEEVSNTLENAVNCVQTGGEVYLMKGPNVDQEIKEAKDKMKHQFKLTGNHAYALPKTPHERRLLVYKKL